MAKFEDIVKDKECSDHRVVEDASESVEVGTKEIPLVKTTQQLPAAEAPITVLEPERKVEFTGLTQLQRNLEKCLLIVDDEVMKGYVSHIADFPVVGADETFLDSLDPIQFFRITEIVYQEDEFSPVKLAAVYSTLRNKPCTLSLMIRSDGKNNEFYLGVRSLKEKYSSGTMKAMLKDTLLGQFPGSKEEPTPDVSLPKNMSGINCISCVTGIADYKQERQQVDDSNFLQGMEKFVDGMHGRAYTALFLAENLSAEQLGDIRRNYENIYTQLSPFANVQLMFSSNETNSSGVTKSQGSTTTTTEGHNENRSVTDSQAETETHSTSTTEGNTVTHGIFESNSHGNTSGSSEAHGVSDSVANGASINTSTSIGQTSTTGVHMGTRGLGVDHSVGVSKTQTFGMAYSVTKTHGTSTTNTVSQSVSDTLSHGINNSTGTSTSATEGSSDAQSRTHGIAVQEGTSNASSESVSFVNADTLSETFGKTQGITLNAQNRTLADTLKKLDRQIERVDECESIGMWNFSAYFLGESAAEAGTAAYMYQSVVMGNNSSVETSAVNTWNFPQNEETEENKAKAEAFRNIYQYLYHSKNPEFCYYGAGYDKNRLVIVDPTSRVSTNELALHMGLPRHSVKGLPVMEHTAFAQEVIRMGRHKNNDQKDKDIQKKMIQIGNVYHLGETTATPVELDLNSLAMHTFISGSTGSGKSNIVYHILSELRKKSVPFLVIEPAKGEYHKVFPDVAYYGTNPSIGAVLQLNPFAFPKEIHVLEHIDRLVEIISVCWPMYAAMPAVLKDSIERAYRVAGWNLKTSHNKISEKLFPTFSDVLHELDTTISESKYSQDTKGDYIGSLSTRLKSLTNGINGEIFTGNEIDLAQLFDRNAIIDISHVGSMETKALIMGIVVLKLQEYRISHAKGMNSPLSHITVLEEAHNLLKKTSTEQSQESANVQGKSVEMLTNTIAEIRTYGEGFIIVDQAPNMLDTAVIRNTNTKIILRLPEKDDREITGKAMTLNDDQIMELARLETGVGAVYQNDWQAAVLCDFPYYKVEDITDKKSFDYDANTQEDEPEAILHALLKTSLSVEEQEALKDAVLQQEISARTKKNIILNMKRKNAVYKGAVAAFIDKTYDTSETFNGTSGLMDLAEIAETARDNLSQYFTDFNQTEIEQILYYVCEIMHKKYPENILLGKLTTQMEIGKVV